MWTLSDVPVGWSWSRCAGMCSNVPIGRHHHGGPSWRAEPPRGCRRAHERGHTGRAAEQWVQLHTYPPRMRRACRDRRAPRSSAVNSSALRTLACQALRGAHNMLGTPARPCLTRATRGPRHSTPGCRSARTRPSRSPAPRARSSSAAPAAPPGAPCRARRPCARCLPLSGAGAQQRTPYR
jgi:hypothetical protein